MVKARIAAGSPAMDMVLTALVITDNETVGEALKTAATLSREHPSRVLGIVLGDGRGAPRVDAKVRVGENSAGESVLLRLSGPLVKHADSVVLPLLLPDSPVVAWWPRNSPTNPSADAIGQLAQRRLTDAESSPSPVRALKATARHYVPGDTDLTWTRLTPWRAVLAAALDQSSGKVTGGSVEFRPGNPVATLLIAWLESRLRVPITQRRGDKDQISKVVLPWPTATSPSSGSTRRPATSACRGRRRARCHSDAARWPSCWPRTCAVSTPTTSTPPP